MYPFMYIYLGPIQPACCRVQYSCLAIYTGLFIYRCILYIGIFVYIYVYSFVYICIYLGPVQTGVLQGAVFLFGDPALVPGKVRPAAAAPARHNTSGGGSVYI